MENPHYEIIFGFQLIGFGLVFIFFGNVLMGEWINKVTVPGQNKIVNPFLRMFGIKYPDLPEKDWKMDKGVRVVTVLLGIALLIGGIYKTFITLLQMHFFH